MVITDKKRYISSVITDKLACPPPNKHQHHSSKNCVYRIVRNAAAAGNVAILGDTHLVGHGIAADKADSVAQQAVTVFHTGV